VVDAELARRARDLFAGGVDRDQVVCRGLDLRERGRFVLRDPVAIFGRERTAELGDGIGRVRLDEAMQLGGSVGQVGDHQLRSDVGAVRRGKAHDVGTLEVVHRVLHQCWVHLGERARRLENDVGGPLGLIGGPVVVHRWA